MSVEFVEPDTGADASAPPVPRTSALPGRLVGTAAAVAGVVTLVATQGTLYTVVRTASIVDFDGTTTRVARIPVDAFGHSTPVLVDSAHGLALSDVGATVSAPEGIAYGPWWLGLGAALLVVAVWCVARPRSSAPLVGLAALGGALLGSVGAAWLSARTVTRTSVPQIRLTAAPAPGLWLLVGAGALALLAAAARQLRPRRRPH